MNIDIQQLEINVNLYSLQPGFLNYELYYIIATDGNTFRLAEWDDLPGVNEQKFYCFLLERKLYIPAGNITLNKSYVLKEEPIYPVITNYTDFIPLLDNLGSSGVAKCIKHFSGEDVEEIKIGLEMKYGPIEKHIVTSNEAQHLLLVLNHAEISVSATMVYLRPKAPFSEKHYGDVKE